MHVCIFAESFPARSETFVLEHVVGLARRGYQVSVVSMPGTGVSMRELEGLAVEDVKVVYHETVHGSFPTKILQLIGLMVRHPSTVRHLRWRRPWYDFNFVNAVFASDSIGQIRPDIVHVHYGNNARRLNQVGLPFPMVVTWHGRDANMLPKTYGDTMYKQLFRGRHYHTVGSAFMKRRLLELGANHKSLRKIPMGVDLDRFSFLVRTNAQARGTAIVSVGRLDEMKGHRFLIDAVASLISEGISLSLKVIGDGPLKTDLEQRILDLGCSEQIQLLGARTPQRVLEEYQHADLFALTGVIASSGRVETQGVALIEAQATGLPVIASNVGGVPDSVEDQRSGILCPPGDVKAIKDAIRLFVNHPEARSAFGKRGREFVVENFSNQRMLDSFEDLYSGVLNNESAL